MPPGLVGRGDDPGGGGGSVWLESLIIVVTSLPRHGRSIVRMTPAGPPPAIGLDALE
jgi:hypothetical protein